MTISWWNTFKMYKFPVILVCLGVGLVILGTFRRWAVVPPAMPTVSVEKIQLVNGTKAWERWARSSNPIYMNIYIFNTTNPEEVMEGGKPIVEEFGPYVYEESRAKVDLEVNEANNTVFYLQTVRYFFRPDLSNGTEEDQFVIINMPLVALASAATSMGFLGQQMLSDIIEQHEDEEQLFSHVTAGQLLYHGRYVPMMRSLEESTGADVFTNYTFGVFFPKNGSDEGMMEVNTGVKDSADLGKIVSWKGQTSLSYWDGDTCNMINGTDGSLFPPLVHRDQVVRIFSPDLCRSLYLKYTNDYEYRGIKGYQFSAPKEMLEGAATNPDNACFCKYPGKDYSDCMKSGVIPLSACQKGTPIVMSNPHFFDGDEEYVETSIGFKPDRGRHLTYTVLEPNTGLVIEAHKRVQVNVKLEPNEISGHFAKVPSMVYPVLWYDEAIFLSGKAREEIAMMRKHRRWEADVSKHFA